MVLLQNHNSKEAVESHFGVTIIQEKLLEANRTYNETRRLLKKLYDMRSNDEPRFTGAEMLVITTASTVMPKMEYNRLVNNLLEEAEGVVLETIKFCDMHGTDNALINHYLEKEGIPVIELERQYGPLADAGRVRTRVQAFLERIGR
jgi:benzoyl-CoA reductase/2-hydroxyglutaryl-CoA dehydratase subunit BcrC/BadD/HgdB